MKKGGHMQSHMLRADYEADYVSGDDDMSLRLL